MTRQEAKKLLLNDTKVYVNGKSEEIQKTLFSLGFKWCDGSQKVKKVTYPFLFLHNGRISWNNDMIVFTRCSWREITPEDILNITSDEPKYRPFKDASECWQEMLKHQPFGWIKYKEKNCWVSIGIIEDIECDLKGYESSFEEYTFVDGTPFGIKEN